MQRQGAQSRARSSFLDHQSSWPPLLQSSHLPYRLITDNAFRRFYIWSSKTPCEARVICLTAFGCALQCAAHVTAGACAGADLGRPVATFVDSSVSNSSQLLTPCGSFNAGFCGQIINCSIRKY